MLDSYITSTDSILKAHDVTLFLDFFNRAAAAVPHPWRKNDNEHMNVNGG